MKSWKAYERKIATSFGASLGGNWMRVPSSGAFVGGKNQVRLKSMSEGQIKTFSGDIIPPDEWDFIQIECKTRQTFSYVKMLEGKSKDLDEWLTQTYQHNPIVGFLVFKFRSSPSYIAYEHVYGLPLPFNFVQYKSEKLKKLYNVHIFTTYWLTSVSQKLQEYAGSIRNISE